MGIRLPTPLIEEIKSWEDKHEAASSSEAIRRLVGLGLTVKTTVKQPSAARADRAKELASKAIENLIDPSAPPEERSQRRQHLSKGPLEFREDRVDLPKAKN